MAYWTPTGSLRGDPSKPPPTFLFSLTNEATLTRNAVAPLLNSAWQATARGKTDWTRIESGVLRHLTDLYERIDTVLRILLRFDALPETYRDRKHVRYHSEHTTYLVKELFERLRQESFQPTAFKQIVDRVRGEWHGALTGRAVEDIATGYTLGGVLAEPEVVKSLKVVDDEYLRFLGTNPDVLDFVAWEAFEKVVQSVFENEGCEVHHVGLKWGASADLLVIKRQKNGQKSSWIVECKRYDRSKRIGLDIINSVLGSMQFGGHDAAFLVTNTKFSEMVEDRRDRYRDLKLTLRDGQELKEWLTNWAKGSNSQLMGKDLNSLWVPPGFSEET